MSPNDKIYYGLNIYGRKCYMGRRTAAHLDETKQILAKRHPGAMLHIIQSAYNTGVRASAGTHDKDACLDVYIAGLDWYAAQAFLRSVGWAAWYRYPPLFGRHIHMISLGYGSAPVGYLVPGQVRDYYNYRTGLAGHAHDGSWHPKNINATIFDYAAYEKAINMPHLNNVQSLRAAVEKALHDYPIPENRKAARIMVSAFRSALKIGPKQ